MSDLFERIMKKKMERCSKALFELYNFLTLREDIHNIFSLPSTPPNYDGDNLDLSFNMHFKRADADIEIDPMGFEIGKEAISKISGISVHYSLENLNYGKVIEIALINKNGKCIYVSDIGYDYVNEFYSYDEFINELKRIHSEVMG